jgi:hypothetical protein
MKTPSIRLDLVPEPAYLTPQTLSTLVIRILVTNLGNRALDGWAFMPELLVDGQPSLAWSLAIGNGTRDAQRMVPPGGRIELARCMGNGLFNQPGGHTLVVRLHGVESPPVKVYLDAGTP